MLSAKVKWLASAVVFNLRVQMLADRVYLRQVMFPAIAATQPKNVLLVGTRRYTTRYPAIFDLRNTTVWTLDYDPAAARFGHGQWHRTGDIRLVDEVFAGQPFDVIHANGVLGFGVDSSQDVRHMISACHRSLTTGGHLMLGWDEDRIEDPLKNADVRASFSHTAFAGLPARHRVEGVAGYGHVFDWFTGNATREPPQDPPKDQSGVSRYGS